MVDRAVEEALLLGGVKIDTHHTIGAGGLVQVGNEARRNGFAALVFLILTGIGVEGGDCGDALRGSAFRSVDHDELLHDPLIDVTRVGLQDEDIRAANRFVEADVNLTAREVVCGHRGEAAADLLADFLGEFQVCST